MIIVADVEGSGAIVGRIVRSKGIKHEIRKLGALLDGGDGVVVSGGVLAADGQQNLLSQRLARLDVVPDKIAVLEELRLLSLIPVDAGSAVGGEVGTRKVTAVPILGRQVHET